MEEGFCPAPREGRAGGKSFFVIARREKKEAAGAAAALACSFAAGFRHFVGDASLAGGPRTRKALELAGAPRVSFRSGQDSENLQKTGLCGLGWIWPIERGKRWAATIKICNLPIWLRLVSHEIQNAKYQLL
jgi:hypothetical protein